MDKKVFLPFLLGILAIIPIVLGYYLLKNNPPVKVSQTTSSQENGTPRINPKMAAFVRNGQVWIKNFSNGNEAKISKTEKVEAPKISPDGKYIAYFSIASTNGGFLRSDVFISSLNLKDEQKIGIANISASRIAWSKGGDYLGLIVFPDGRSARVVLYDPGISKSILETEISSFKFDKAGSPTIVTNRPLGVTLNCPKLNIKYIEFCNFYESVLNNDISSPEFYKTNIYATSKYKKPGFKLSKSEKLQNDLVKLEFNKGVNDTYTILLDEINGKAILEIPQSTGVDFLF